jgi:dTDP-4-amino-4,6-dideoxygalactose transaminase
MMKMIPINRPQIGELEIEEVNKVLKSCILTHRYGNGPMVKKFEEAFAKFTGTKHAVAVNSGTASLHMSLLASGVTWGDEVIVPSFTFVATAEAVALTGAKPVFVDIDPKMYNIDPEKTEKAITKKTKAILPVDLYGLSADINALNEIAQKHDLTVIEDAAQAQGAMYQDKPSGYLADLACWSFYASKNMTTGEGGMVTTNSNELNEKLRSIRTHGEMKEYNSFMLGHNYRMPEIEAAIGHVQLSRLPEFLEKRRKNAELMTEELNDITELQLPTEPLGYKHGWYLYTVRLRNASAKMRNELMRKLREQGIGVAVYYSTPIHLMPYYDQYVRFHLPETEKAAQQVFSLPIHPSVTVNQIKYIATSIINTLEL